MPFKVFPYSFSASTPVFFSHLNHDFFFVVRYKIFTTDGPWIEVCQSAVFSKMDITMTTINKIQCHNLSLCVTKINLTLKAILEKQAAFTLTENVFVWCGDCHCWDLASWMVKLLRSCCFWHSTAFIQMLINVAKINIA